MKTKQKMATFLGRATIGVAAALMLAGVTTSAQGFLGVGANSSGSPGGGLVQIRGNVVCVGCDLIETKKARPAEHNLYQLTHRRGQIVMKVTEVNGPQGQKHLLWPPKIHVRAKDSVFEKLTVEGNLFKDVEVTGFLRHTRTLDVSAVTILG